MANLEVPASLPRARKSLSALNDPANAHLFPSQPHPSLTRSESDDVAARSSSTNGLKGKDALKRRAMSIGGNAIAAGVTDPVLKSLSPRSFRRVAVSFVMEELPYSITLQCTDIYDLPSTFPPLPSLETTQIHPQSHLRSLASSQFQLAFQIASTQPPSIQHRPDHPIQTSPFQQPHHLVSSRNDRSICPYNRFLRVQQYARQELSSQRRR